MANSNSGPGNPGASLTTKHVSSAGLFSIFAPQYPRTKLLAAVIGVAYTGLVGTVDLAHTSRVNLDLLYLLGCGFVGWAAGRPPAVFIALLSGTFLYLDGVPSEGHMTTLGYLNWAMRVLAFVTVGLLANELGKGARNLETKVQERTAWLQSEVEQHKKTAAQLRDALELFKQVTENITEVFWVTDTARRSFSYISGGFEKVWGRPRQALYTSPSLWLEAVAPEDREWVTRATFSKQLQGTYDEEYRIGRPDGSFRWVHDRAFPVLNAKSEVYRLVGIAEDVTDRKKSEQVLEMQREAGAVLSVASELDEALEGLLATVLKVEGIHGAGAYLVDPATGNLDLESHTGLSRTSVRELASYPADSPQAQLVQAGSAAVRRSDGIADHMFWPVDQFQAIMVAPLKHEGAVVGALVVASRLPNGIPPQVQFGLEMVAAQAAGVIARIGLQRQILEISDREQARIGRDIHDGLCQQLIGVALNLRSVERSLVSTGAAELALIEKIAALADEAITESRRVCRGLYPIRLERDGLIPALEELTTNVTERYGIPCKYRADIDSLHCDLVSATHLYRIAQEAVNNAVQHSHAREISVHVAVQNGQLELAVKDDGIGMQKAMAPGRGMGRQIMDYRARTLGGTLIVGESCPGTTVTCRIPYDGQPNRELIIQPSTDD